MSMKRLMLQAREFFLRKQHITIPVDSTFIGSKNEVEKSLFEKNIEFGIDWSKIFSGRGFKVAFIGVAGSYEAMQFRKAAHALQIEGIFLDIESAGVQFDPTLTNCELIIARPEMRTQKSRHLHGIIIESLISLYGDKVVPQRNALDIYESKIRSAYFRKENNIPSIETNIFFRKKDAVDFVSKQNVPLVFKSETGASASGVKIGRNMAENLRLVESYFDEGVIDEINKDPRDKAWGYCLIEKYIEDFKEFRIIRIYDSWFAHEKLPDATTGLMSGSNLNAWTIPDHKLFDFCSELTERCKFEVMALDIFVSKDAFFVNEMQYWFGSYADSQMFIEDIPGRYLRNQETGNWDFEKGYFNEFGGMSLRIVEGIAKLEQLGLIQK